MPTFASYSRSNARGNSSLTQQVSNLITGSKAPVASTTPAQKLATTALTAIATGAALTAANAVASSVESLLSSAVNMITSSSNTTNSGLTNIKQSVSDPTASSLMSSGNGGTGSSANVYLTSPYQAQIDPVDFSTDSQTSALRLSGYSDSQLAAMASRAGVSTPISDSDLTGLQSTIIGNATSLNNARVGNITYVSSPSHSSISAVQTADSIPIDTTNFINSYSAQLYGVPNASELLASNYNSSYGLSTGANGVAIAGVPTETSPALMSALNLAMAAACPEFNQITVVSYADQQSFSNTLLGLILDNGILALFSQFANCIELFNDNSRSTVLSRMPNMASKGQSAILAAACAAVGGAAIAGSANLIRDLCYSTPQDTTIDEDTQSIMTATGQSASSVFAQRMSANQSAWNATAISGGNRSTTSGVVGSDLYDMSNFDTGTVVYS